VQYKLLVRAINESTNTELAQLVSQSFSVSFSYSFLIGHDIIALLHPCHSRAIQGTLEYPA